MKRLVRVFICIALICASLFPCTAGGLIAKGAGCPARQGEDFYTLRQNMIAVETASLAPGDVYNSARSFIDSLGADGLWADVDYITVPLTTHPAQAHVDRMRTIAHAYCIPNQPLFQSEEALEAIERALPGMETKLLRMTESGQRQAPGNWWWYNLYFPPRLGFVLAAVEGKIDETVYHTSLESLRWCLSNPLNWYMTGLSGQATNSTDAIKGNLWYAVLAKNEENIRIIADEYAATMQIVQRPYEGLTEDGGNIAHMMIDFYAYYGSYIPDTIRLYNYFKDTSFAPPEEVMDIFANSICEGASWAMYQDYRELGASGRTMRAPFTKEQTQSIITGLEFIAGHKGNFQARAQELLDRRKSGYEMHTGQRYFYNGDFTVHKTDESYVSLRTSSSRTRASETWSGYGQTNTFMADGCMWIYNDAAKVYETPALACLDWTRLAGTTVLKDRMPQKYLSYYSAAEPFVGGVSDGDYGISAMSFAPLSLPLSAKKSWFFFDDEVVCVGSDIESSAEEETHTIIDQRKNNGAMMVDGGKEPSGTTAETLLKDVTWIANDGVGYYFPQKTDVNLKKEHRDGSWNLLCVVNSDQPLSADFSSLYFNHGAMVHDGSYAYAVLPNAAPEQVAGYAKGANFEVLENSAKIHAVRDVSTDSVGVVFWPDNREFLSVTPTSDAYLYDGIISRDIPNSPSRFISARVKGEAGAASTDASYGALGFAVSEQRLNGDVDVEVKWFDDKDAQTGSYWQVQYLARDGVRKSRVVPYRYTDEWTTTVLTLEDAAFSGTGLIEDGVELAIVHSNTPIDTNLEKYELMQDYTMNIAYSTTLYGPLVQSVKLSPHGKTPSDSYSAAAAGIATDTPCIVYRREKAEGTEISVCDPTQLGKTIHLTLDGVYTAAEQTEGISCTAGNGKTNLTVCTRGGKTYTVLLKK